MSKGCFQQIVSLVLDGKEQEIFLETRLPRWGEVHITGLRTKNRQCEVVNAKLLTETAIASTLSIKFYPDNAIVLR
jgi:hypothetical protein